MALVNNHSDHVKRLAWNILRGCLEINSSQIASSFTVTDLRREHFKQLSRNFPF